LVSKRNGMGHLHEDLQELKLAHSVGARRSRLCDHLSERGSAHELHREVEATLLRYTHLMYRYDCWVLKLRGSLRLLDESRNKRLVGVEVIVHDLHRDVATQFVIEGAVYAAIPPFPSGTASTSYRVSAIGRSTVRAPV